MFRFDAIKKQQTHHRFRSVRRTSAHSAGSAAPLWLSAAEFCWLVWDSIQNIIFWQNKGLHCEELIRKCHQSWLEVNLYWNHHPIKTIMSGIYGGYALENGLTSPTGDHAANLQTSNMSQWVILLWKHHIGVEIKRNSLLDALS